VVLNFSGKVTAKRIVSGDDVVYHERDERLERSGTRDDKDRGRSDKDFVGHRRIDNR
jgi:hypothetical protein